MSKKKKPLTIKYKPEEIEINVCQILHKIEGVHSAKHIIKQLYVNCVMEGLGNCSTLSMLKTEEEVDKIVERVEAADALMYLQKNWKKCVKEGKKLRVKLEKENGNTR